MKWQPKNSRGFFRKIRAISPSRYFQQSPAALSVRAEGAWTLIRHRYPGIYPYEMARGFLGISLIIFVYYIFRKNLARERGWLYIAVAASGMFLWDLLDLLEPSSGRALSFGMGGFFSAKAAFADVTFWLYWLNGIVLSVSLFFLYLGIRWHYKSLEGKK